MYSPDVLQTPASLGLCLCPPQIVTHITWCSTWVTVTSWAEGSYPCSWLPSLGEHCKKSEVNGHTVFSPKIRQRLILIFALKNTLLLVFMGCFIFFMYNNLHLFKYSHVIFFWLLHNSGGRGFTELGLIFGSRAYITSTLKNHTRAYFQVRSYFRENRVPFFIDIFPLLFSP